MKSEILPHIPQPAMSDYRGGSGGERAVIPSHVVFSEAASPTRRLIEVSHLVTMSLHPKRKSDSSELAVFDQMVFLFASTVKLKWFQLR